MSDADTAWLETATRTLPVGTRVTGVVTDRRTFGCFVRLESWPEMRAIVEINNFRPTGRAVSPRDLPTEGSVVEATVIDHSAMNQQIRLRVAPDD